MAVIGVYKIITLRYVQSSYTVSQIFEKTDSMLYEYKEYFESE
jgi:hypothetical protein